VNAAAAATHSVRWRAATSPAQSEVWETPPDLYLTLEREFDFTLDAAAGAKNATTIRYFDRETDALAQSWAGERVFCNPPYGRELGRWVEKAREAAHEHGALVVLLLPARTDTIWFHRTVLPFAEIRFLKGRLNYRLGGVSSGHRAPFASMVVVFRPDDPRAERRPASRQGVFHFPERILRPESA
jgi:phage N-6-adenine-methyltransferase